MPVVHKPLGEKFVKGMTVRQHMALQFACATILDTRHPIHDDSFAVKRAVRLADLLLAELEPQEESDG